MCGVFFDKMWLVEAGLGVVPRDVRLVAAHVFAGGILIARG